MGFNLPIWRELEARRIAVEEMEEMIEEREREKTWEKIRGRKEEREEEEKRVKKEKTEKEGNGDSKEEFRRLLEEMRKKPKEELL